MSDTRRGASVPIKAKDRVMSTSTAAGEAFDYLNALQRMEYRGWGDTASAARDRAAKKAGVTPAQAERVWKRWRSMTTVNGDVYRLLRNRYEATCQRIEQAADAIDRRAAEIEEGNAAMASAHQTRESNSSLD